MHLLNSFGLIVVGVFIGIFITAIMTAGKQADELWNAYKKGYEDGAKASREKPKIEMMNGASATFKEAIERIKENAYEAGTKFAKTAERIKKLAKEVEENIKNMPEEEFNRLVESPELDEELKELAKQIRTGA